MENRIIHDAQQLIEQYIAPQTRIELDHESLPLEEMAALLKTCNIPYLRKAVIMGCYYLLCLSISRHREVKSVSTTGHDNRARMILDGDYLLGSYVQFAIAMEETRLMHFLNSLYKKIQIELIHGSSAERAIAELPVRIIQYIRSEMSGDVPSDMSLPEEDRNGDILSSAGLKVTAAKESSSRPGDAGNTLYTEKAGKEAQKGGDSDEAA